MRIPRLKPPIRNTTETPSRNAKLPRNGTPNTQTPIATEISTSATPITKYGVILPRNSSIGLHRGGDQLFHRAAAPTRARR